MEFNLINYHIASLTRDVIDQEGGQLVQPMNLSGEFTFVYGYPLTNKVDIVHTITPEMTCVDVLMFGKEDYERIYREEDAAFEASCKLEGNISGLLNRARSNGPHGIYGHDLHDLYFEGINFDVENRTIKFDIGS